MKSNGEKIAERSARMSDELRSEVDRLDALLATMRAPAAEEGTRAGIEQPSIVANGTSGRLLSNKGRIASGMVAANRGGERPFETI